MKSTLITMLLACLPLAVSGAAQEPPKTQEPKPQEQQEPAQGKAPEAEAAKSTEAAPGKAGAVDREGAALRNENVFASRIDTETQKLDNQRMGGSYTPLTRELVEFKYFGSEYGNVPVDPPVLGRAGNLLEAWHGELYESLQNSVFNARTFFQSGSVLPSRLNQYGGRFSGRLPGVGYLSGSFGQNKVRGMVNGNVLVPLPTERTPLATDPATRAIVSRFLGAYPLAIPNRTDIDPHALNYNAPQTIDATNANLRLDRNVGQKAQLSLFHDWSRKNIHAFQLVAGQNPDTMIHAQRSRIAYRITQSPNTEYSFGANFSRLRSDLHADPTAVGPRVRSSNTFESLGPQGQYPLNRIENTFRYGALGYHRFAGGRHRVTFGGDLARNQLNGFDQKDVRGELLFSNNRFPDDFRAYNSIENFLRGRPTSYFLRFGNFQRGFRSWVTELYVADEWNVLPNLQLYFGLRHSMVTAPTEVNNLNTSPYGSDANNFSPRFGFAYRGLGDWVFRGSYNISFGEIFPVTYSQIRYSPPLVRAVNLQNPILTDLLRGVDLNSVNQRAALLRFNPDLATPYAHQYTLTMEHAFGPMSLTLAYLGSRSIKVFGPLVFNRARYAPGATTGNVNQRRPDQSIFEDMQISNAGMAYLDAAQVNWRFRSLKGFTGGGTFTWSKALDQGSMYNSTAANNDLIGGSQAETNQLQDLKGLSQFDSPYSLALYGTQTTPSWRGLGKAVNSLASRWQISGIVVSKSGTPFTLNTGSDAPGFGNVDGTGGDRPNVLNPSVLGMTVGNPDTSAQIMNFQNFGYVIPGQVAGNIGRNTFRKGAIFNVNASVAREWKWGGRRTYLLRFQADAFNLTNHPQFEAPQINMTAPSFGKITNTLNNGRVLQLGLRLVL